MSRIKNIKLYQAFSFIGIVADNHQKLKGLDALLTFIYSFLFSGEIVNFIVPPFVCHLFLTEPGN